MKLVSHQLEAFLALARHQHFSRAAKSIHISQPALTQRIQNLEQDLGHTLFVRKGKDVCLTDIGEKLLTYSLKFERLASDFEQTLNDSTSTGYAGFIRIAGYSSITRSIILPALADFLRSNPRVCVSIISKEMSELDQILLSDQADFIFLNKPLHRPRIDCKKVGVETYVAIKSKYLPSRETTWLDHDKNDETTQYFLCQQSSNYHIKDRCFLDDIYGLLDAVALGMGYAVVPIHLVDETRHAILSAFEAVQIPIYMLSNKSDFTIKILQKIEEILTHAFYKF